MCSSAEESVCGFKVKRHSRQMFFVQFFPPWFSLSAVESSIQALMSSQRQYFVDIICLPVSLPALSRVATAKLKNIGGFNKE